MTPNTYISQFLHSHRVSHSAITIEIKHEWSFKIWAKTGPSLRMRMTSDFLLLLLLALRFTVAKVHNIVLNFIIILGQKLYYCVVSSSLLCFVCSQLQNICSIIPISSCSLLERNSWGFCSRRDSIKLFQIYESIPSFFFWLI